MRKGKVIETLESHFPKEEFLNLHWHDIKFLLDLWGMDLEVQHEDGSVSTAYKCAPEPRDP